eukprot:762550-Hanusia_phi.AAC.5
MAKRALIQFDPLDHPSGTIGEVLSLVSGASTFLPNPLNAIEGQSGGSGMNDEVHSQPRYEQSRILKLLERKPEVKQEQMRSSRSKRKIASGRVGTWGHGGGVEFPTEGDR